MTCFAYFAYTDADRILHKHALSSLNNDLETITSNFNDSLKTLQKNLFFLQQSGPVLRLSKALKLKQKNEKEIAFWQERVEKLFKLLLSQNPSYINIYVVPWGEAEEVPVVFVKQNRGHISLSTSSTNEINLSHLSDLLQLAQNKIYFSDITLTKHDELSRQIHPEWQVNIPLYLQDKSIWSIGITANLITNSIAQKHSKPDIHHFITDQKGNYLSHNELAILDPSSIKKIHSEYPTEDFFLKGKDDHNNLSLDLPKLGVGIAIHKVFFDPLHPDRFITFGAVQSYASLSKDSREYRNKIFLILFLIVVILGCLTAIAASIIVRPVTTLTSISNQIAAGDENIEIPVSGNDEITLLAQSLKIMLERILSSKNDLYQLSQTLEAQVRERTEELLQKNEEYAQIFNTAADGLVVIGKDFNILRVNTTIINLFDSTGEKVIGEKCYAIFPGPLCQTSQCPMERIKNGEDRIEYESIKHGKDNIELSCLITATPYQNVNREFLGIVENFKDITDRKKAEEEREKLIQKLQKAIDEIKTLSGIIPICSSCKKIRDDKGYWKQVEVYIEEHSKAQFSHAMCKECCEKLYGGQDWYEEGKKDGAFLD